MAKFDEIEPGLGRYHAVYEHDESGAWIVHVREARICHTYGRSIPQARQRIREALSLFYDDAETAEIVDVFELPADARAALDAAREKRRASERANTEAVEASRRALRTLQGLKLSQSDVAAVLGVSPQRVSMLLREQARAAARAKRTARRRPAAVAAKKKAGGKR